MKTNRSCLVVALSIILVSCGHGKHSSRRPSSVQITESSPALVYTDFRADTADSNRETVNQKIHLDLAFKSSTPYEILLLCHTPSNPLLVTTAALAKSTVEKDCEGRTTDKQACLAITNCEILTASFTVPKGARPANVDLDYINFNMEEKETDFEFFTCHAPGASKFRKASTREELTKLKETVRKDCDEQKTVKKDWCLKEIDCAWVAVNVKELEDPLNYSIQNSFDQYRKVEATKKEIAELRDATAELEARKLRRLEQSKKELAEIESLGSMIRSTQHAMNALDRSAERIRENQRLDREADRSQASRRPKDPPSRGGRPSYCTGEWSTLLYSGCLKPAPLDPWTALVIGR